MTDLYALLKDTAAFTAVQSDKKNNTLSHAYLILCADGAYLREYIKIFAKTIFCKELAPCGECRACRLIDSETFSDASFYPAIGKDTVSVEDVADLIGKTYLKPVEGDKKLFVISDGETMSASVQNKLLKTLEEPPVNVHIIIGARTEYPLLPTVKSRVKKLEIPFFSEEKLIAALKKDCPDEEKLLNAVSCGDGTLGKAKALYGDEKLGTIIELAADVLVNMQSSKDVLQYSAKINALKVDLDEFLSVLELLLRDLLLFKEGKEGLTVNKTALNKIKTAQNFNTASIIYAIEKITETRKRKKFNTNGTMLIDGLLFSVLEGKHKWLKL